ncbi:MAG: acyl carrier protein [Holophagales bacterium]|nr:acyl carrier protein [Holophagales bacterium]
MDSRHIASNVIGRVAGVSPEELRPEQHLMVDLGIDSPKGLQLVMDLEDALGIEIDDDQVAGLQTVGDVLDLLARES